MSQPKCTLELKRVKKVRISPASEPSFESYITDTDDETDDETDVETDVDMTVALTGNTDDYPTEPERLKGYWTKFWDELVIEL